MIIIPDVVPAPATDYDRGLATIRGRLRLAVSAAAAIPPVLVALGVVLGSSDLMVLGFVLTFPLWGAIGAFIAMQSDRSRERRRRERRQFHVLEGSELSSDDRRAALQAAAGRRSKDS